MTLLLKTVAETGFETPKETSSREAERCDKGELTAKS
jgi:hypothetical protein